MGRPAKSNDRRLNIENLGKQLNLTSIGEELKMVTCPKCSKTDIVNSRTAILVCVCGAEIIVTKRWYEDD